MSASLLLVGVTSFMFHATLRQTFQLSDDVSMLLLAAALLQALYCNGQPAARARLTTGAIYACVCAMSAVYVRSGDVRVHACMFAGLLQLVWPRTLYLVYRREGSDPARALQLRRFRRAVGTLVFALGVWYVDLEWCAKLRRLRGAIGLPWAWLLELHGWWHVLTAAGAATYIDLVRDCVGRTSLRRGDE